jgi:pyrimidine operon attenuation protein/uracil phosphoribosyltransferase
MALPNPPSPTAQLLLDAQAIERAIRRIAHEIVERNSPLSDIALIGIPSRGIAVARRLAAFIEQIEKIPIEQGVIDVGMHRDDLHLRKRFAPIEVTQLPLKLEGHTIILVDDVAYTGRTCRAAMDALSTFGRPARIQFAALVDRGHRELPIRPDYVGKNIPTALVDRVYVRFAEVDEVAVDGVWIDRWAEGDDR